MKKKILLQIIFISLSLNCFAMLRESPDDSPGKTALIYAVEQQDIKMLQLLIENQANVNIPDGQSPLFEAVKTGNKEIVELLISKGANVNYKAENGETSLLLAVQNRSIEIVKMLIAKKADVNPKFESTGKTALMCAVDNKDIEIAKLLIKNGAQINSKTYAIKNIQNRDLEVKAEIKTELINNKGLIKK